MIIQKIYSCDICERTVVAKGVPDGWTESIVWSYEDGFSDKYVHTCEECSARIRGAMQPVIDWFMSYSSISAEIMKFGNDRLYVLENFIGNIIREMNKGEKDV